MAVYPVRKTTVELRDVGDEVLVHDMQRDQIHVLNATAGWVLRACDGQRSLDEITEALAELTSEERKRVYGDVAKIVGEFDRLGVVALSERSAN